MKAKTSLLLLTVATTLGLSGPVVAKRTLETPDELVCEAYFDNSVHSTWESVEDATYYAVDVNAEYDVSGDGEMDRGHGFHFGTADPELELEESDLMGSFVDDDGLVVQKKAMAAKLRVKAVRVPRGHRIGLGHLKVSGDGHYRGRRKGHYKDHGIKSSDYAECRVTFTQPEPDPDPGPCPFFRC